MKETETATPAQKFGALLRQYRERTRHKSRGKALTQEKFADLLGQELNTHTYTGATISNWELGKNAISHTGRRLLTAIIKVLHEHGGLHTEDEANTMLEAGGYANLSGLESDQITPEWRKGSAGYRTAPRHIVNRVMMQVANHAPASIGAPLFETFNLYERELAPSPPRLYESTCGNQGLDLAHRRLFVSSAFGTYFTGLLERENGYVSLAEQVDSPVLFGCNQLSPTDTMMLALTHPQGPRVVVIGSDAGMGKSSLAAKIVRCLLQQQAIDLLLGDSAKKQHVDPLSGELIETAPGFYDAHTCYTHLYTQLGLPPPRTPLSPQHMVDMIKGRLVGRRAIIVLDNLDTVRARSALLDTLRTIGGRDVRVLVTTRTIEGMRSFGYKTMMIQLKPIATPESCRRFLAWHVAHFQTGSSDIRRLDISEVADERLIELIVRTGGNPLLIQLVISTVARTSWSYIRELPALFGLALLHFLYAERWQELEEKGPSGQVAQSVLRFVARNQYEGNQVTLQILAAWLETRRERDHLQTALHLLFDRFMLVNEDRQVGNFTIFPSLAEFLEQAVPSEG